MNRSAFLALSLLTGLALSGCNTFGGIGKDLSQAGDALENSAEWSQQKINETNNKSPQNSAYSGNSEYSSQYVAPQNSAPVSGGGYSNSLYSNSPVANPAPSGNNSLYYQ